MAAFRPIQYLGSKQRLAETIAAVVAEVAPGTDRVGDLFAGSGVVSAFIGRDRPVTAVDVQAFSEVLTTALLEGRAEDYARLTHRTFIERARSIASQIEMHLSPLLAVEGEALQDAVTGNPEKLVDLMEFGSLAIHNQRPHESCPSSLSRLLSQANAQLDASDFTVRDLTATRYFGGPYFAYRQAIALDAIYISARMLKNASSKRHAMAVLLSTASEIVNTVGKQFAQPMRLKKADGSVPALLLRRALRDRAFDAIGMFQAWAARYQEQALSGPCRHDVVRGDVLDFVERDRSCRMYYADPPYTIDHYSRFYHVLETLVLRDSPKLAEMTKSGRIAVMRGVYRADRHQSLFCVPSTAPQAFAHLFSGAAKHGAALVMSYSPYDENEGQRARLMPLKDLVATAGRSYRRVSVMEITGHSHRKLNAKAQNTTIRSDAERLIICEA
ncbi:site-specific DNA-methyltransferase [Thermomonas carbonis]|nr:site-specific DNA-methyltransferase [Thermomonas carbonis]